MLQQVSKERNIVGGKRSARRKGGEWKRKFFHQRLRNTHTHTHTHTHAERENKRKS